MGMSIEHERWVARSESLCHVGDDQLFVTDVGELRSDSRQVSFSVLFDLAVDDQTGESTGQPPIEQGTYSLVFADGSAESIFLVPIGPTRLEAVFTRVAESEEVADRSAAR